VPVHYVAQVAARVPTETIGLYLAGFPFIHDRNWQRVLAVFLLAVTPLAYYIGFAERKMELSEPVGGLNGVPWADLLIATVAFVVWVAALPNSVLNGVPGYSPQLGGAALLITAFLFGLIDRARRIRWRS
jgi:hypothetical protein